LCIKKQSTYFKWDRGITDETYTFPGSTSGLRVSEVAKLKIGDICSKTMRIRVERAKHNTNRYTILSNMALQVLRGSNGTVLVLP
jgi:integrase